VNRTVESHRWDLTPKEAAALQAEWAEKVVRQGSLADVNLIAGADAAFARNPDRCIAGVVVWDCRLHQVVEEKTVVRPITFPYVPGLLSFREAPAVLEAIEQLDSEPDAFMFDGHGFSHPRRFGLACHVGVLLDRPSIGCAKSRLVGDYVEPDADRGATAPLLDGQCTIGTVLRTRDKVKPVFVSVGHLTNVASAARLVLRCCSQYRLPEPTRLADRLVTYAKKEL
jgi:deoxyribonuclease V